MSGHPIAAVLAGTPHRHPMLLVDRILSMDPGRRATALKAVSAGELQQAGDGEAGLAPTLLVDALGQLAIAVLRAAGSGAEEVWYLGSVDGMEFDAPARAGDVLLLEADVQRTFRGSSRVGVRAQVDERTVARGFMVLSTGAQGRAQEARR